MGPLEPISGRAGQEVGRGFGAAEVESGTPGLLLPRPTTPLGKMPGGPGLLQALCATTFLLFLISAGGLGTWLTGWCWEVGAGGAGRTEEAGERAEAETKALGVEVKSQQV